MRTISTEVEKLRQLTIAMGEMAVEMVRNVIQAGDSSSQYELIQAVLDAEEQLDRMQLDVDKESVRALTVYSPVAFDLRFVISVSRIAGELERIGDQATNICEILRFATSREPVEIEPEVRQMATIVEGMLSQSLAAFVDGDVARARSTIAEDDRVDALNDQITRDLLSDDLVRNAIAGEADILQSFIQVLVARALERIADHATNVSEEVVYIVQGEDIRHEDEPPVEA